jgi:hypothetical protein
MRGESVAWERAAEVHDAAESWHRAGAIDDATRAAILAAYPDPCVTPSIVWRALAAVMVSAVVLATLGAVLMATQPDRTTGIALLFLVFAAAALVVAERVDASPRHSRRGLAGATSFWGCAFTVVGIGLLLRAGRWGGDERALSATLLASTAVWAAGCWRWGHPLFAGASALSLFAFLGRLPAGRVLWLVAGAALTTLAVRPTTYGTLAPSHRRSAMVLVVAGLLATYAAVNVYSLDQRLIEDLRRIVLGTGTLPPGRLVFALAAVGTAALPFVVLAWAVRARWTLLLDVGIVLLALSLVTLRHYVHVAPLWLVLTVAGGLLIALALAVERWLREGADRQRAGFTAEPLFSDERRERLLQGVPVVAGLAPAASAPASPERGFAGQGGQFGGGGASGRF